MTRCLYLCLFMLTLCCIPLSGICADETGMDAVKLMKQGKTEEALAIFKDLAAKGDMRAMEQLGNYYYEGFVVKQDYSLAMDWWLKALDCNSADAFVNIALLFRDGNGVPKNKKIAYCIFLITHMEGLGSDSTQLRSNSCLRRIIPELSNDEIKDCLSNYTLVYIIAYIKARGKMEGIPEQYKPSSKNPALRDLNWWFDGELDSIYGPPTEEEKKARKKKSAVKTN